MARKLTKTKRKKRTSPKKKIKVLAIGDHPFLPSGVGHQCKLIYKALVESGDFEVFSFGGAVSHQERQVKQVDPYGEAWKVLPVDGYGTPDLVRSFLLQEKPDMLWFMTDPRFYGWLWQMEDEVRPHIPMVYYHVWDNYPYPMYNKPLYDSTDAILSISKLTHDIVTEVGGDHIYKEYVPHSVDTDIFRPLPAEELKDIIENHVEVPPELIKKPFKVFWNNRNARRKQSGSLVYWFGKFAEKVGKENVLLIMHTDPKDPHGQDLVELIKRWNLRDSVIISHNKYPPEHLNVLYNICDCTISVSDAEGFGLSTLESLAAGTPIIATRTGGLQDQLKDDAGEMYGISMEPTSKSVLGSQEIPYIFEDRLSEEVVVDALTQMYEMTHEEREAWGQRGRDRVFRDFNYEVFQQNWVRILKDIHARHGSWPNKLYSKWEIKEIK